MLKRLFWEQIEWPAQNAEIGYLQEQESGEKDGQQAERERRLVP